jgi:hypothetical protein
MDECQARSRDLMLRDTVVGYSKTPVPSDFPAEPDLEQS